MKIRFATLNDIPAAVEVGRQMCAVTRYQRADFNAVRVADNLSAVITQGQQKGTYCFFVAEDHQGHIVGGLIGRTERHFFADFLVATVINYVVLPDRRMSGAGVRLLTAFRKWAQNRDVFELSVGINSGTDLPKLDKFLKRMGFQCVGGNYAMRIGKSASQPVAK